YPQLEGVILALAFNLPTKPFATVLPNSFFLYLLIGWMPIILLVRNISSDFCSSKGEMEVSTSSRPSVADTISMIFLRMMPPRQPSDKGGVFTTLPWTRNRFPLMPSTTCLSELSKRQLAYPFSLA